MKFLLLSAFLILGFNACAEKKEVKFYDRANKASEKSLNGLERDTSK